jgi:hypothetical protein
MFDLILRIFEVLAAVSAIPLTFLVYRIDKKAKRAETERQMTADCIATLEVHKEATSQHALQLRAGLVRAQKEIAESDIEYLTALYARLFRWYFLMKGDHTNDNPTLGTVYGLVERELDIFRAQIGPERANSAESEIKEDIEKSQRPTIPTQETAKAQKRTLNHDEAKIQRIIEHGYLEADGSERFHNQDEVSRLFGKQVGWSRKSGFPLDTPYSVWFPNVSTTQKYENQIAGDQIIEKNGQAGDPDALVIVFGKDMDQKDKKYRFLGVYQETTVKGGVKTYVRKAETVYFDGNTKVDIRPLKSSETNTATNENQLISLDNVSPVTGSNTPVLNKRRVVASNLTAV